MDLRHAYDADSFRQLGHDIVDQIADYLSNATSLAAGPTRSASEQLTAFGELTGEPGADPSQLFTEFIAHSHHLHQPRSVGHQVAPALPLGAVADLVTSTLNNSAAIYEMGPVAAVMETRVIRFMSRALGLPENSDGVLTSGGSLGNLTAMLAIRRARANPDVWSEAAASGAGRPAILVSDQAHYCVDRAVGILGWGQDAVVRVPTSANFRLDAAALSTTFAAARARGLRPVAVVASACSTSTGAIDPLNAIADFCASHELWFHVDGAHGASLTLSDTLRDRVRGIERADSVVWDAHKLMLMPSFSTAVLFRDAATAATTFQQDAGYLFVAREPGKETDLDIGQRTLECTKPAYGLKLYAALATHGTAAFARYIEAVVDLTAQFAQVLDAATDFELAVSPDANIVCFRYLPAGAPAATADELQARVRAAILVKGEFFLTQTVLGGKTWLRCTILHPHTTLEHLTELLDRVRQTATETSP